jgi:hypothetical protein
MVSPAVLIGVISIMSTLGLMVLWINDQLVYQRLLDCGFIIALKMEYHNSELPPIRIMMMYSSEGKGMSRWMTYFYTIPMWAYLLITVTALFLRQSIGSGSQGLKDDQSLLVLIVLCFIQLGATIWVHWKKSAVGAKNRAILFGDKDFTSMFEGTDEARTRLANIIERHNSNLLANEET